MAHAVAEERPLPMGLPVSNGKLAMWLFLVTEIMFFTGLIGTYALLRMGTPEGGWPAPRQVHLKEYMGAINTFVLIASSFTIVLAHGAYLTLYGHLSRIGVRCGLQVSQGTPIGAVGTTGNSSGPHLHFEIRPGGEPVNPTGYLAF